MNKAARFSTTAAAALLALLLAVSLLSCLDFDNPLDPEGSDYQGYLTVDGTDEIATCVPADEGTMYGNLTLAWTKVRSASRYHIRVSTGVLWISDDVTDLDTSAIVFEDSSCPANVCVLPEEGLESGSSYYWQVRAMDSETGAWGLWSSVSSFSYAEGSAPLVSVPGGTFLMGYILGDSDETTERMITLDSFCIGTYEVTRSLYKFIMGEDPSGWMPYSDSGAYPVESVSWRDAVDFCNALSEYEGLDPVYSTGLGRVKADLSRNGYRLPTEAEWEYAARGGPFSLGYLYAGSDTEYEVSWFFFNGSNPTVVGSLEPNELGIYDMSGNVAEWCWDWYYDYQYSDLEDVDNPQGPKSGSYRVIRGGSYSSSSGETRVSNRDSRDPDTTEALNIGFRVARRSPTPSTTMDVVWSGITPEDAGTSAETTPLLQWTAIDGADLYQIQFTATTGTEAEAVFDGTDIRDAETAEYRIPDEDAFSPGDNVYWRVRVWDEDTGYLSPWSETYSLSVTE